MTDSSGRTRYDQLRKQAKRWLRELKNGDPAARTRLELRLPRPSEPPVLREIQQALARELGFESWAALKEHHLLFSGDDPGPETLAEVFLEHACIFTSPPDFPSKWRRAEQVRARHPELSTSTLHAAVVCGEVDHARTVLDSDPGAISRPGGPQRWEPILFACYGRLPNERARERALEMAALLLDRGANPNAHFVTNDDWRLRFTALTGALGQGEMGQPEHPRAEALARLLLDRGAEANDSQGLYNTHLVGDDTRWLELLSRYGLGPESPIQWHADPTDAEKSGSNRAPTIFGYLLAGAAKNGHVARLTWLLEHGADPDARSIYDGSSSYQHALIQGTSASIEALTRHGASIDELAGHDAFVAAARSGDRPQATALLESHPEYAQIGDPLTDAAQRGESNVVRTLLELGVDPNATSQHGHRALHNGCENRELASLLLQHGADPRSLAFGGTACEWALRAGNPELARFHAEQSRSLLDAARSGHVALAQTLLSEDPSCTHERDPNGNGAFHELTSDPELAEPLIRALLTHGGDPRARNDAGKTPAEHLEAGGADEVADVLEALSEA